jgi:hypothetical protein
MEEDVNNLKAMALQEQLKVDRKCEPFATRGTCRYACSISRHYKSICRLKNYKASGSPSNDKGSRMGKDLARKTFAHHRKCSLRFNVDYLERVH